jgi:hypothetical protein
LDGVVVVPQAEQSAAANGGPQPGQQRHLEDHHSSCDLLGHPQRCDGAATSAAASFEVPATEEPPTLGVLTGSSEEFNVVVSKMRTAYLSTRLMGRR